MYSDTKSFSLFFFCRNFFYTIYTENIFYTDDVAGFVVHNENYETGHQLAKPSSVLSVAISAIRIALERN
jgi:hypothetical protein